MPLSVFGIVLFAALLHASWNAIVKGAPDKLLTTILVASSAAAISALALPFLAQPARESWPFLATSAVLQVGYYLLVARAYRGADMSQAYPLMRGTAPLIVALVSSFWLGEILSPAALAGVALICGGVLSLALAGRGTNVQGLRAALLNAVVIASYTLVDGAGVRASGAPAAYTLWLTLLSGVPLLAWVLAARWRTFLPYARAHLGLGVVGGFGTLTSYGLALWAMTHAPVAVIAALRETSILFATAIAAVFLKEKLTPARIAAACLIAAGAVVLRLK
ncbi:MAG: EamA family transporter [Pseudomonadota bacterium]|uniref:EamA family transporter n=1 Tax=Phenylobacterium sp. TaxID=1871053 RepID=UPI0025D44971|nr:EamA family transporter [Phenylobacterium sp.]MBT9472783.1 EamA family transporter [Phenylobacterium sp.]